jgi:hypothetical protein
MRQNVMVQYTYRTSAAREGFPLKGRLYHFAFSQTGGNHRSLDYRKILEQTEHFHPMVAYIILDSFQRTLEVSMPALYPAPEITTAAERFYDACGNSFTFSYREVIEKRMGEAGENPRDEVEAYHLPFVAIAREWPHYVIPPGHVFEFLYPDCPCSFFEA